MTDKLAARQTARTASQIDKAVGQHIRALRQRKGLSQQDLGDAIGCQFQQVQKYETGANRVAASNLWRIAEKLEVSIGDLFAEVPEQGAPSDALPRHANKMIGDYLTLPREQQEAIRTLIDSMSHSQR